MYTVMASNCMIIGAVQYLSVICSSLKGHYAEHDQRRKYCHPRVCTPTNGFRFHDNASKVGDV